MSFFKEKVLDGLETVVGVTTVSVGLLPFMAPTICAVATSLIAAIGVIKQGPLDFTRTVYNTAMGDSVQLKHNLLNYGRKNMKTYLAPGNNEREIEDFLVQHLHYSGPIIDGKMDATRLSTTELWDLTERFPKNAYERWVWPNIGKEVQ